MKQKLSYFLRNPFRIVSVLLSRFNYFKFLRETKDYQGYVTFSFWFIQKILNIGGNKEAHWPVHYTSQVYDSNKIKIGVDSYPGIMKGCYIQGKGGIQIGDFTQFAPNVVIVSANHDVYDTRQHILSPVKIGSYCWIGAGAKIMPGVTLGDFTIVGAGSVVTRSFEEGYCVIAGVPARKVKSIEMHKCIEYRVKERYLGYIKESNFAKYNQKKLMVK